MPNGADTTYPRGNVGDLIPLTSPDHSFEESGGLHNFPLALLNLSVPYLDMDVSVSLDAGHVVNLDRLFTVHFLLPKSPHIVETSLGCLPR